MEVSGWIPSRELGQGSPRLVRRVVGENPGWSSDFAVLPKERSAILFRYIHFAPGYVQFGRGARHVVIVRQLSSALDHR